MPEPTPGMPVTPSVRLDRPLGAGAMGSVWLADHLTLGSQVVVKFMSHELARSADAVQRFSREAATAFQVRHPHVVQILDHGVTGDGIPFIVMELLEGRDLGKHLEHGRLAPLEVARIVTQAGKALDRMHERGVVHRDIKPENIFLCDVGGSERFVKVLDFGVAKRADALRSTRTGAMLGTPYYMSPEQMSGARELDHRTDLWSLGVVAFFALTGRRPFDGETLARLAVAIHGGSTPSLRAHDASLPAALDAWFARACAREPAARFSTARDLSEALEAAHVPTQARTVYAAPTPVSARTEIELPTPILGVPAPARTGTAPALPAVSVPLPLPAPIPAPYIPPIEEDDDEPEPRGAVGRFVLLLLLLGAVGLGLWLYWNPWAVDQALDHLRRLFS